MSEATVNRLLKDLEKDVDRLKRLEDTGKDIDLSDPITFVEKYVPHPKGKAQSLWFDKRPYLSKIYRDQSKNVIIVKGRQMEVSEFAVNMLLYWPLKYPGTYVYASATDQKTARFSKDRFRTQLVKSQQLKTLAGSKQVYRIEYGRSIIYFYTAFENMDTLRGIPADMLILDEFQDMLADALPVAKEMLSKSDLKRLYIIGTPKEAGTKFEDYWHASDMKEWSAENQDWVPSNEKPNRLFSGYHISQEMGVGLWMTQADIEAKRNSPEYSNQLFMNEVLGQFYTGIGRPVTPPLMASRFDPLLPFRSYRQGEPLYMGVDWGIGRTAYTCIWVIRPKLVQPPATFDYETVYVERIDLPDLTQHTARVLQLMREMGPSRTALDVGEGYSHNFKIYQQMGDKMMSIHTQSHPIPPYQLKTSEFGYVLDLDRTYAIDHAFDTVVTGHLRLPKIDDEPFKAWIIDNFTCMYPEVRPSDGKKEWKKDPSKTNDALMAYINALFAFELDKSKFMQHDYESFITFI